MTEHTIAFEKEIPDIMTAMESLSHKLTDYDLAENLFYLVLLRASQMNQCAFCVKMHLAEAKSVGESDERLHRLVVWRQVSDFSDAEKAALAWTEALTQLGTESDFPELRAQLRLHFSENAIAALTASIATINFWNRIGTARH